MANAVIEANIGITGLTLTVDLYPLGSDTIAASAVVLTEATNRKGLYTGTTAAALTGLHNAFLKTGTTVVGIGFVVMSDDTDIHRIVDTPAVTDKTGLIVDVNAKQWLGVAPLALSSQQVQAVVPSSTVVASMTGNVGGNVTGSVGSVVGAVGSVTGLTASNLDATISSRMATYTQPTGFLTASFTTIQADLDDIQTRLPAALVSGRIDASVGAMAANVVTAAAIADGAIDAATFAAGAIDATAIATDALGALELAAGAASEIATAVGTQITADHGSGSYVQSGGAGARSVTITVNDGAAVLEAARVRMSQGAESYVVATNASGVAVFALDDATWTVTITKAGYTHTPTTIVVNGTETQTYSMTLVTVTPSDAGATTGYITIRTIAGVAVSGATVKVELRAFAAGTTGSGVYVPLGSAVTNASGYAEFVGLPRLADYRVKVGTGAWYTGTTADAATTPLTAVVGVT